MNTRRHRGEWQRLLRGKNDECSFHKQIDSSPVSCFIFHSADKRLLPVQVQDDWICLHLIARSEQSQRLRQNSFKLIFSWKPNPKVSLTLLRPRSLMSLTASVLASQSHGGCGQTNIFACYWKKKCQELIALSCQKPRRMMLKIKSKVLAAFSD